MNGNTIGHNGNAIDDARHRELAVEHLLFGTLRFLAKRHPDLLDELDASLSHLGDMAHGSGKDDSAVRHTALLFLKSLRRETEEQHRDR